MKMQKKSGFTIIEVMLFLAITGLLIAGILGGTAQSLNSQRYRAGVEELRNDIRSQYATSLSLRNLTEDSSGNATTGANSVDPCSVIGSDDGVETHTARGTSNCLYVGRLLLLQEAEDRTSHVTIYPVVAKVTTQGVSGIFRDAAGDILPPAPAGGATDQNSLQIGAFTKNSNIVTDKQVNWGLIPVTPKPNDTVMNVGILVFRSPISGTITTYVIDDIDSKPAGYLNNLQDYMDTEDNVHDLKMCMADLAGPLDQTHRMAIIIHAGATGPSDIETQGEAAKC